MQSDLIYGLTHLGVFHTGISLIALAAGIVLLVRDGAIGIRDAWGKTYWVATFISCVTSLGIFQHGGFGKPHILALLTLGALALALIAGKTALLGRFSPYVETVCYSATFLFHLIPGITETTTRLPLSAPLLPGPEAPELQAAAGVLFLLFLVGAGWQVWRLRRRAA